jgi:hypothetical protein
MRQTVEDRGSGRSSTLQNNCGKWTARRRCEDAYVQRKCTLRPKAQADEPVPHAAIENAFGMNFLGFNISRRWWALAHRIIGQDPAEFIAPVRPLVKGRNLASVICSEEFWKPRMHRQVRWPLKCAKRSGDFRHRYLLGIGAVRPGTGKRYDAEAQYEENEATRHGITLAGCSHHWLELYFHFVQ